MANIIGEVEYSVSLNTETLKTDIKQMSSDVESATKEAGSKAESASSGISEKLGNMAKTTGKVVAAGVAAGTAAIAGLAKSSINAYADYEQLTGGVETLFKGSADRIKEYADNAYKTAGLSANQYMETVTSFSASLLQGLGGDTEKAATYADMAVTDMADNANKMGTSMSAIQNAYQGFAKQNYTMLDNLKLGYGGTASEMARLVKDSGVLGEAGKKLTAQNLNEMVSFDQMVEAIHKVQDNMGITGTTSKEAADTISGSIGTMKSAWENVLTVLGTGNSSQIAKAIDGFVNSIGQALKNIVKVLPNVLAGLKQLLDSIVPQIPSLLKMIIPVLIDATIMVIEALVEALPEIIQALVDSAPLFVDAVVKIVEVIIANLPQIIGALIQALFVALGSILSVFARLNEDLNKWLAGVFTSIGNWFKSVFTNIGNFFKDVFTNMGKLLQDFGKTFESVFTGVGNVVKNIFTNVSDFFSKIWNGMVSFVKDIGLKIGNAIGSAFKSAINGVLAFIENFINGPVDLINGFLNGINDTFGAVLGFEIGTIGRVQLPRMATGGIVESTNGGQLILAGEAGEDEWVVPESKMASMIEQLQGTNAGGSNITIEASGIYATTESQKREVAMDIWEKINEINKTRMGVML